MSIRSEWNKRAEENAYHYVSTFREEWDDESFYRWGEVQTQVVIDRFLKDQAFDPSDRTMLEIGCGAGRMARTLASRFKLVYAYDVSDRYIQIAREKNSYLKNVVFRVNDGLSFPEIEDESVDFVFSGWTIQHMPTKDIVVKNIKEIARTLKKGGLYKIDPRITAPSRFKEFAMSKLVRPIVLPFLVKDKLKSTPTFTGVAFTEKELVAILSRSGLTANTLVEEDGSERFYGKRVMKKWFYGKKES
jgi:ubiquinone/menaquinone biosynthesis C-methylase UbiE